MIRGGFTGGVKDQRRRVKQCLFAKSVDNRVELPAEKSLTGCRVLLG